MKNIAYGSVSGLRLGHTSEAANHFCFIQKGKRIITKKKKKKHNKHLSPIGPVEFIQPYIFCAVSTGP